MAFKKLLFWLPGAVSFLSICAIGYMPVVLKSQSDSEAEIRVLTERYFAAYAKKDLNGLTSLWSEKSPELAARRQSFQQTFAANTTMELKRLIVRKVTLTGDKATARVVIEIDAIDAKTRKRSEELVKQYRTLHFTNEGVWRVWRDVSSEEELAAAISKAKTDAEREVLLEADKELITVELRKGLTSQAIQFANRGSYTQANPIFQLSLNIAQDLGEKVGIAVNLRGIGFVYASQGKYTEALEYHRRSLAISEEIEDKPGIVRVLNLIGVVHQSQGNYTLALEHCRKSLAISGELGDKPATAGTLHNIGNIHWSQGNYAQALEYYQKSLAISVEVSDKIRIPRLLNNIGNVHQLRGSYPQSLEYYQKSLALSMELDDRLGTATALNNLGVIHQLQGNYPQALEHYQKSLTISKELGDKTGVVRGLNNVGEIQNLQASYAQAIDLATQAAVMAGQIGSLEMLWQAQTTTGQAYQALNKTEQAQRAFSDAIAAIEQLRDQIAGGEQQRQLFFEGKVSPYHAMVDLLISQNNPAQALRFAERAKARALLDVLQSGQTNVTKAMTVEERERERILNSELVSLNIQIYREKSQDQPDQSRLNDLTGRLKNTRLQIEAFHTNLYAAHPD